MLAAAILAAGESRRMGYPKALISIQGQTFLDRLLTAVKHPRVEIIRVILGAGAEEIRKKISVESSLLVVNSDWQSGQLSSIQTAIRSLPPGRTEGLLLCPVDHPLISSSLVGSLIEHFDSSGRLIIAPTYSGRRGHPVIFRSTLYPELLNASSAVGARQVVWAHKADIAEVPTMEEGVILNLDDPDSLRKVLG
jgi:molybdenum cofactor cytidylyltransferase